MKYVKYLVFMFYFLFILDLKKLLDRQIENLSGGELQRVACAVTCLQLSDVYFYFFLCLNFFSYIFDEPSSYLDVKQRLKTAQGIRSCVRSDR